MTTPVDNTLMTITLMTHRCCQQKAGLFIVETTTRHRNVDEMLMVVMQTLKIINVYNVQTSETSMFQC